MRTSSFTFFFILLFSSACFAQWTDHSMHFPQTPKPGGWDIGSQYGDFILADDWRCSKTGVITNIIFWGSWREDRTGEIRSFLITIYKNSTGNANIVWKGTPNTHDYPDYTYIDFTVTPMPPDWQGWLDASNSDISYDLNDHQQWVEINIHNFEVPLVQQEGTTYWIKIEEVFAIDPNDPDPEDYFFPTIGWKESDKHFGKPAKIYCNDCSGWKSLSDPITGDPIDLAFVILTAPPEGDITKDGKVNYEDIKDLAETWLNSNLQQREVKELLGQWEFGQSDGNDTVYDSSGHENTATIFNGPYQLDGAMVFDGIDDYLCTAEDANKLQLTNDYSLMAWLKADPGQKQWAGIISKSSPVPTVGSPQNHWSLQFGAEGTGTTDKIVLLSDMTYWDTDIKLADLAGNWHHVAVVRSGNSMISFLDGQIKKYSGSFEHNPVSRAGLLKIGTEKYGMFYYAGQLDDIRIYNYPLSTAEIQLIYQAMPLPAPQENSVCYENIYAEDLNKDCRVNWDDFAILAKNWLTGVK